MSDGIARFTRISCREHSPQAEVCASVSLDGQLWGGVRDNTTKHAHDATLPRGSPSSNKSQAALLFISARIANYDVRRRR